VKDIPARRCGEGLAWTIARSALSWCSRSASPQHAAANFSTGYFENTPPMMPGASSASGSFRQLEGGGVRAGRAGRHAAAAPSCNTSFNTGLGGRLGLEPFQLGLGTHVLLRGAIQRRARGRGIKLALGLAERLGRRAPQLGLARGLPIHMIMLLIILHSGGKFKPAQRIQGGTAFLRQLDQV
jgi:hypothetical protein